MDRQRIENLITSLNRDNIDQFVISDMMSIYYLIGRKIDGIERMNVLLVRRDGYVCLVTSKLFPQPADLGIDVFYYDDTDDPVKLLVSKMVKANVTGIDKVWPAKFLLNLISTNISREYLNASYLIDRIRQIKTPEEIVKMEKASHLNDQAMDQLIKLVTKGFTEVELGDELLKIYKSLGAQGHSFEPICGYGDNAADPHHLNDDSTGKIGDSVVLDIGCLLDGYCSDMTRTVFIGKVSEDQKKIYEIVKRANELGIEKVKPGVKYSDIDKAARDYITNAGYGEYFTHRLGHNIGMEVHEWGDVSSSNDEIVKPGMIFSIEPGIYLPGTCGVRIEDLVVVTEDGCKVLNEYTKDLIIVE